jgi:hypothetical protein
MKVSTALSIINSPTYSEKAPKNGAFFMVLSCRVRCQYQEIYTENVRRARAVV